MRTLVVHLGALGDFIVSCPALETLGMAGPVTLLGAASRHALAVAAGLAERAVDLDAVAFHTAFSQPSDRLLDFFARFDRAILWMRDAAPVVDALTKAGVRDVRTFPGLPDAAWTQHASDYYLGCVGAAPGCAAALALGGAVPGWDIVIHPGSGSQRKNWALDAFARVAAHCTDQGRQVTWLAGPAEAQLHYPAGAAVVQEHDLVALGRRLAAARLYLGNDSGISHLSAAVGCPSVVLFGPGNPQVWAPCGAHVHVVQGTPWPRVATVQAAMRVCSRTALDA